MAVDKILPLKLETPAGGGSEFDMLPTELDYNEDYVSCKGLSLQNSDTRLIDLSVGGNIQFTDVTETTAITVTQLHTASFNTFTPTGGISSTNVQTAIVELDTEKADKTITISAGTGLTGGGTLAANRTISMPNVGTPGTYGSASAVSVITTDTQGRVSNAVTTSISILSSQVSNFAASVLATTLTGLSVVTSSPVLAADSILVGIGKLQAQITTLINRNINTGTGLSGGGNLSADRTIIIANTAVTAGSYGSASLIPTFTVNAQGQLTAAASVLPSLNNIQVSATASASAPTGADVLLNTMTVTPSAGTYLLWFSTDITSGSAGAAISVSVYLGGTQQTDSLRKIIPFSGGTLTSGNARAAVAINGVYTVNGSQALEIRWSTSNAGPTAAARTMNLLRVG